MRGIERVFKLAAAVTLLPGLIAGGLACSQSQGPSATVNTVQKPVVDDPSGSGAAGGGSAAMSDEALCAELDEVLEFTYDGRHLNLKEHAAWQILHGVLAYQDRFLVMNEAGQKVPAVDHVLNGGQMTGWTMEPGDWLDEAKTRRGLRAVLELGTKTGQGHADQWFAILAQTGLEPSQKIILRGEEYTLQEMIEQALWDVPRNVQSEYSWTLIGLTTYLPTDYSWTASDGKTWTIDRLVENRGHDLELLGTIVRVASVNRHLPHDESLGKGSVFLSRHSAWLVGTLPNDDVIIGSALYDSSCYALVLSTSHDVDPAHAQFPGEEVIVK